MLGMFAASSCKWQLIKHSGCTSTWLESSLYSAAATYFFSPLIFSSSVPYSSTINTATVMLRRLVSWIVMFSVNCYFISQQDSEKVLKIFHDKSL